MRPLVVEPETGTLIAKSPNAASEPQHRPSRGLDRAVRERDVTCRFPGCRRSALTSASGTDVDHTVPYPAGVTGWDNLAVLCRRHHRLKHSLGWRAQLSADGTMTWTTPTGRRYVSEPWHYIEPKDTS